METRLGEKSNELFYIVLFLVILLIGIFCSLAFGAISLSFKEILRLLFTDSPGKYKVIIADVRLPRTLVAVVAGMSLSVSGCIMQGLTRNPLASPSMLGITSGASLVAFVMMLFFPKAFRLMPTASFIGALLTTLLIYLTSWRGGVNPIRFILSGVAISSVLGALYSLLTVLFPEDYIGMIGFNVGSLSARTWEHLYLMLPYSIIGLILSLILSNKINLLMMGDEVAIGLGLDVEKSRFILIVVASLLAGSAVSVVGMVSFVGLCIPHITRMIVGSNYKYLIPASAINGASFLVICDTLARVLIRPSELPVGIILSAIGAPFFLYLLRNQGRM